MFETCGLVFKSEWTVVAPSYLWYGVSHFNSSEMTLHISQYARNVVVNAKCSVSIIFNLVKVYTTCIVVHLLHGMPASGLLSLSFTRLYCTLLIATWSILDPATFQSELLFINDFQTPDWVCKHPGSCLTGTTRGKSGLA